MTTLLKLEETVKVETAQRFVVAEHYRRGIIDGVQIIRVSASFYQAFGNKVEENLPVGTLRVHRLLQVSLGDNSIIKALGNNQETTLCHLWELISAQGQGQDGILLVNGHANIAYIRDDDGTLWTVYAKWYLNGWNIECYRFGNPVGWTYDVRVFSR